MSLLGFLILFIISLFSSIVFGCSITNHNKTIDGINNNPNTNYESTVDSLSSTITWNWVFFWISIILLIISFLFIISTLIYRRSKNYKTKVDNPITNFDRFYKFFTVLPDEGEKILLAVDEPTKKTISKMLVNGKDSKTECGENEFVEFRGSDGKYCFDIDKFPEDIKKVIKDISEDVYKIKPELGYKGAEEYAKYIFDKNLVENKDGKIDKIKLSINNNIYTYDSDIKNDDLDAYKKIENVIGTVVQSNFYTNKIKNTEIYKASTNLILAEKNKDESKINEARNKLIEVRSNRKNIDEYYKISEEYYKFKNIKDETIESIKNKDGYNKKLLEKISPLDNIDINNVNKVESIINLDIDTLKNNINKSIKDPHGLGSSINPLPWLMATGGFVKEDSPKTFSEIKALKLEINKK